MRSVNTAVMYPIRKAKTPPRRMSRQNSGVNSKHSYSITTLPIVIVSVIADSILIARLRRIKLRLSHTSQPLCFFYTVTGGVGRGGPLLTLLDIDETMSLGKKKIFFK